MTGKAATWILVIVGGVLIVRTGANVYRLWKTGGRMEEAKRQLAAAEAKNQNLKEQLQEAQTPEFMDRQVREKLGYGKPGEVVVVIPDELASGQQTGGGSGDENRPNWEKWRKLYLGF